MTAPAPQIDVRAPRFAAALTSVVLAVALLTGSGWLVAAQALVFAVGALAGLRFSPVRRCCSARSWRRGWGRSASGSPRRRRGSPSSSACCSPSWARPATCSASPLLGAVATGLALVAALLNAATGFCLGCELYLTARRVLPARTA